jgi:hypothetical protein
LGLIVVGAVLAAPIDGFLVGYALGLVLPYLLPRRVVAWITS